MKVKLSQLLHSIDVHFPSTIVKQSLKKTNLIGAFGYKKMFLAEELALLRPDICWLLYSRA